MPDNSMDFNSRYYLIESVQQILNVFGSNCVVEGMEVSNLHIENSTGNLSFSLSGGKVIVDSTLIEFPTGTNLNINLNSFTSTGRLILVVSFKYLRTSKSNMAIISLKYLNSSDVCSNWFIERDNLILSVIHYDKINNTCFGVKSSILQSEYISINNNSYEIYPHVSIINSLRPVLSTIFNRLP